MEAIPRTQVIPFTVLGGQTLDMSACTRYDHSKVVGVVLLPDKDVFRDEIYLEINKQTVLPYGFNAGLISFRQFMNKEMRRSVYEFEEWAQSSDIRIIYKNNDEWDVHIDEWDVHIDMLLLTKQGDTAPITKRKKLQLVHVVYDKTPDGTGYEPKEIRTKTDFYCYELLGIFNDRFNSVETVYHDYLPEEVKEVMLDALAFMAVPPASTLEEILDKKQKAQELLKSISGDFEKFDGLPAVYQSLMNYLHNLTTEPVIEQSDMLILQKSVRKSSVYDDVHKTLSTLEITVGDVPVYPENFPMASIEPRYRRTFKETVYTEGMPMQVHEADIFIRFCCMEYVPQGNPSGEDMVIPRPWLPAWFNIYFLYSQTVKS